MLRELCFEIIEKCTNKCLFCSSCSSIEKDKIINFEIFKNVIDHFYNEYGSFELSLSGGEPLLHESIIEMIEYCSKKGIKTTVYTSGVVLNNIVSLTKGNYLESELKILKKLNKEKFSAISSEMVYQLKKAGINKIIFDLQTVDYDNYNQLMGTNNNIHCVLKSIILAKKFNITTEIHYIPMKINIQYINDILEICEVGEIDQISFLKFVPQGRGKENKKVLLLSEDEIKEFIKYIEKQEIYTGKIRIGIPLQDQNEHQCTAGIDKISIRYDGAILPCPAFKDLPFEGLPNIANLSKYELSKQKRKNPLCQKK